MQRRWLQFSFDVLQTTAFVAAIALPLACWLAGYTPKLALREQRTLAPPPRWAWSVAVIRALPAKCEAFVNDHFPFRNHLVRGYGLLHVRWLPGSFVSKVLIGQRGWLFFTGDKVLADARNAQPYSSNDVARIVAVISERGRWLEAHSSAFYLVIAPNKHTMYREHLPYTIRPVGPHARMDQVYAALQSNAVVRVIDLRPALHAAKAQHEIYRPTDTHWTEFGALIACSQIIARVRQDFPAMPPCDPAEFVISPLDRYGGELAGMLGMYDIFPGREVRATRRGGPRASAAPGTVAVNPITRTPFTRVTPLTNAPRAVIFRDSFCDALEPFLSDYFQRSTYVWDYALHPGVILREKPQIVIMQAAERLLDHLFAANPVSVQSFDDSQIALSPDTPPPPDAVIEEFLPATTSRWVLSAGASISNGVLTLRPTGAPYESALRVLRNVAQHCRYRLSLRARKPGSSASGFLFVDLFAATTYDRPEQELNIPAGELGDEWQSYSKTFDSAVAPTALLLRVISYCNEPVHIETVRLEPVTTP
jgi:hypothetical protein